MAEPNVEPVEIREAVPADGPALIRAIQQVNMETEFLGKPGESVPWADRAGEQIQEMRGNATGVYILAVAAEEIIGYLGAFAGGLRRTRAVIFVGHVGVRRAYRGRGIGMRLFAAVEAWARSRQAYRLELRVDEDNAQGLALYRKRGFRIEGRIADAVLLAGRWHAHYWMGLPLRDRPEPHWEPLELPPPGRRDDLPQLSFRRPNPDDAPRIQAWEWSLLTGSPFHVKLPTEVSDVSEIFQSLVENAENPAHFVLAAFVGAERERHIVGYLHAWIQPGLRMRHEAMFGLNVLPDYSGCGIGRTLAEALNVWARSRGVHRLTTWILAHNARGLRFAESLGFRREVLVPNYAVIDGRTVDHVWLGKLIG